VVEGSEEKTMQCERDENGLIPFSAIKRLADEIVAKFQPDKIILFGSYAYGTPNKHSDVDLLVVMPAKNEINQEIRITEAIDHPFAIDLLVRTPKKLQERLELGDWFLREVVTKGRVLYEKTDRGVGRKGGRRLQSSPPTHPRKRTSE
jgi:predicted nucleotidyltransferase